MLGEYNFMWHLFCDSNFVVAQPQLLHCTVQELNLNSHLKFLLICAGSDVETFGVSN